MVVFLGLWRRKNKIYSFLNKLEHYLIKCWNIWVITAKQTDKHSVNDNIDIYLVHFMQFRHKRCHSISFGVMGSLEQNLLQLGKGRIHSNQVTSLFQGHTLKCKPRGNLPINFWSRFSGCGRLLECQEKTHSNFTSWCWPLCCSAAPNMLHWSIYETSSHPSFFHSSRTGSQGE